mmetsp:Transcript_3626/g.6210  ORF Transcript_3626/g.6210 Transcript_3626/m.6210 type:complete len:96 (+) Transcript_3626:2308-2595(+)
MPLFGGPQHVGEYDLHPALVDVDPAADSDLAADTDPAADTDHAADTHPAADNGSVAASSRLQLGELVASTWGREPGVVRETSVSVQNYQISWNDC